MRRLVILALTALLLGVGQGVALGDPPVDCPPEFVDPRTGKCVIKIIGPGPGPVNPGDPPPENPAPVDPEDPPSRCKDPLTGAVLGCVLEPNWVWAGGWMCHSRPASPQPPASDPVWPPGSDGEGAIYDCARGIDENDPLPYENLPRWSPAPPWAAPPDPEELAWEAIASMNLRAVDIGIVPEDLPGRVGIIGLPTYMWAADPGPSTWGPITRTASAGPWSVTATANVERIEWNMGDGTVITCTTPGTVYEDRFQDLPSPDCGHTYTEDGQYTVTATSYWVIEWSGLGQSGTINLDVQDSTNITMGEVQVIIDR